MVIDPSKQQQQPQQQPLQPQPVPLLPERASALTLSFLSPASDQMIARGLKRIVIPMKMIRRRTRLTRISREEERKASREERRS